MTARVASIEPPYAPELQAIFDRMMPPGIPPLTLFTTLASDRRLFDRFRKGGLLDKGHLTLHQREIVIDRTTALAGSEYEWGVHIAFFADRAGLNEAERHSLVQGNGNDSCWSHYLESDLILSAETEGLTWRGNHPEMTQDKNPRSKRPQERQEISLGFQWLGQIRLDADMLPEGLKDVALHPQVSRQVTA